MMRIVKLLGWSFFLGLFLALAIQTGSLAAASPKPRTGEQDKASRPASPSQGERAFRQNCSRCHNAPESFPPQISGTIIRHMRVRANLSREDERAILKFLNP
jgi:mono/diheme cytochrome c family protein